MQRTSTGKHSRTAAALRAAVVCLLALVVTSCAHAGLFGDAINVEFRVQDERGEAIPYVTLWWCYGDTDKTSQLPRTSQDCYAQDLWRLTVHLQSSFDFATPHHSPIHSLLVSPMSDGQGRAAEHWKAERIFGNRNKYPERLNLYYTFMKYGYQPAKVDFEQLEWGASKKVTVTLKRDPAITDADKPYLKEYDRIRSLVSDTGRNEARTTDNDTRLKDVREQLEKLAQDALSDGNKPAAARMYARMQVLPEMLFVNSKVVGFSQSEPTSLRNLQALAKAYELDPANPYIKAMHYKYRIYVARERYAGVKVKTPFDISQRPDLVEAISELAKLTQERGDEVWPGVYHTLGMFYADIGEYEKGYHTMRQLCHTEPAYMDCKRLVELVTGKAILRGVPYPKEWDQLPAP